MHTWPAPAKLNLFLHIVGQREDGYHLLQSAIQFVDLCDHLSFRLRDDGQITCQNNNAAISTEDELCIKAAKLLQNYSASAKGVDIIVEKSIPTGAGMGGGSSNAATTSLALNEIWQLAFTQTELEALGLQLGADVPVFIRGQSCWVEGIGEQLSPISFPESWFIVIYPNVHLNTQQMFSDPDLTRSCPPLKIRDFSPLRGERQVDLDKTQNVFEHIARRKPEVERAFQWLMQYASPRLTGSGSALFAPCASKQQADEIANKCAKEFAAYVVKGLNQSPAISRSEYNYA